MADLQLNRIKVILAEQNKTSKWLGEQLGMSRVTISRWVNNKMQPSLEQIMVIANVLNVNPRELINDKTNDNG
jgi:transcriptional regulator with XRE-family HTH domain